jgi:myo-inositol-1-phosphate synthase
MKDDDIGYEVKKKAKRFDSKNGKVTYTVKELLKSMHEDMQDMRQEFKHDICDVRSDIKQLNEKVNVSQEKDTGKIKSLEAELKLLKRINLVIILGIIGTVLSSFTGILPF